MDSVKLNSEQGEDGCHHPTPPPKKKKNRGPAEAGRKRGTDPGNRSACSVETLCQG